MKNKIKNWVKANETVCGVALLCASLCMVAFGGAYLGANVALSNVSVEVNLNPVEELVEAITE